MAPTASLFFTAAPSPSALSETSSVNNTSAPTPPAADTQVKDLMDDLDELTHEMDTDLEMPLDDEDLTTEEAAYLNESPLTRVDVPGEIILDVH